MIWKYMQTNINDFLKPRSHNKIIIYMENIVKFTIVIIWLSKLKL